MAAVALVGAQGAGQYSLDSLLGVRMAPKVTAVVVVGGAALAAALSAQAVRSTPSPTDAASSTESELEAVGEPPASGVDASPAP